MNLSYRERLQHFNDVPCFKVYYHGTKIKNKIINLCYNLLAFDNSLNTGHVPKYSICQQFVCLICTVDYACSMQPMILNSSNTTNRILECVLIKIIQSNDTSAVVLLSKSTTSTRTSWDPLDIIYLAFSLGQAAPNPALCSKFFLLFEAYFDVGGHSSPRS